jgi:hypothetical protein
VRRPVPTKEQTPTGTPGPDSGTVAIPTSDPKPRPSSPGGNTTHVPSSPGTGTKSQITGGDQPVCGGAANCDGTAGVAQRSGEESAGDRRRQFDSDAKDDRDMTSSSITGALKMVNRLQKAITASTPPEVKNQIAFDDGLVKRAQDALGPAQNGKFTTSDAQSANDPVVRQELTYAVVGAKLNEDFTRESANTQKLEDALHGMANESDQHMAGLSSFASSVSASTAAHALAGPAAATLSGVSDFSNVGSASVPPIAAEATKFSKAGSEAKGRGADPSGGFGKGNFAGGRSGGSSDTTLRDRLKRDLAAKAKAEALDMFSGGLKPMPSSGALPTATASTASAEDAGAAAFRGIRGSVFGLGSRSETEAELRRLTREEEASLPAADSPSLFERVHRVHHACQQRGCVVSSAP